MILSWLTDNRPGAQAATWPSSSARSGRDPARLPELLPTGSVLGSIKPEVAEELGLPRGSRWWRGSRTCTPRISAPVRWRRTQATSRSARQRGSRCEVPVQAHRRGPPDRVGARTAHRAATSSPTTTRPPGLCLAVVARLAVGTGDGLRERDADYTGSPHRATAPPGRGGVLFTPWLNGERTPVEDRNLRGAFLNISLTTERAAPRPRGAGGSCVQRALAARRRRALHQATHAELRILGGGALSDLWCQIHADILNRRIERVADPMYANLRGAALLRGDLARQDLA